MTSAVDRLLSGAAMDDLSYEETRELARHSDPEVRKALAQRDDVRPEILYYLADDSDAQVRRIIAANGATPRQADSLLASDGDEGVRSDLAAKISLLAPGLSASDTGKIEMMTYQVLETLARDQAARVRRVIAETLKDVADAPPEVIRRLAHDDVLEVCGPVLEFSPVLADDDLLEIIEHAPVQGAREAVARRSHLGERMSDAIAATDDIPAIAELLGNASAQIREETLDSLIDRARDIEDWQKPLVERPRLPSTAAQRLAGLVAERFLETLTRREDLDAETAEAVRAEVARRLEADTEGDDIPHLWDDPDAERLDQARDAHAQGELTLKTVMDALATEPEYGEVALSVLADMRPKIVRVILNSGRPEAIVSLAWKAGLDAQAAETLQEEIARLPPEEVVRATEDGAFAMSETDMEWQVGLF